MSEDQFERVKVALTKIAEAVALTAAHSGFSAVKRLPAEIEKILNDSHPGTAAE